MASGKITDPLLAACTEDDELRSTLAGSKANLHMSWGPLGASLKTDPADLLQVTAPPRTTVSGQSLYIAPPPGDLRGRAEP